MNLTDFDKTQVANKALKSNFAYNFDPSRLNKVQTQVMLKKVKESINEAKLSRDFYRSENSKSYYKLLFMQQSLNEHYNYLSHRVPKIVVENEEVEKSQVILAAQDMVDSIQKMLEDVGQMQVKELPALVSSIESEMDDAKANQYNTEVSQQLQTLSTTLNETFTGLKNALNQLTGEGGEIVSSLDDTGSFDAGMDVGADLGAAAGAEAGLEAGEEMAAQDVPEPQPVGGVGRAKR